MKGSGGSRRRACCASAPAGSVAGGALSRRGRRRHARPRRLRRRRRQQSAAPDHPRHAGRRPIRSSTRRARSVARAQPRGPRRDCTTRRSRRREREELVSRRSTSSSTAPTTFPTRYLVNDACVLRPAERVGQHLPVRRAGVGLRGARTGRAIAACIRSRRRRGSCRAAPKAGVLGVLPGIIGTIQATEAMKLILGIGEPLVGRFLVYDALKMRFRDLKLPKDPDCPVCGTASDDPRAARVRRLDRVRPRRPRGPTCIGAMPVRHDDRHDRDGAEGADRRGDAPMILDVREPRRSRSAGFPAPCSSRSASCRAPRRARSRAGDRRPLQGRRPQRERDRDAPRDGLHPRAQSDRRHPEPGSTR